jgi:hypothetical protein
MFVAMTRHFRRQGVAEEHLSGLVEQLGAFVPAEPQTNLPAGLRTELDREYRTFLAGLRDCSLVLPSAEPAGPVPELNDGPGEPLHIANLGDAVFALGRSAGAVLPQRVDDQSPSPEQLWQRIQFLEREVEAITHDTKAVPVAAASEAVSPHALDFVVVGAQKAGTTAIWEFLGRHPGVYLPPGKETRFFQFDEYYDRGRDWFEAEYFTVPGDPVCGMATPHVMGGTTDAPPAEIARRLRAYRADLKLVAVLRDPIERAVSHHRMMIKRGEERRPFGEAVQQQLAPAALEESRRHATETNTYVTRGEYGRVLGDLLGHFPREQVLVVWTEDLAERPTAVVAQVAEFLGLSAADLPAVGGAVFVGGSAPRVDQDAANELRTYLADRVWAYVSEGRREEFEFFFEMWNTVPDERAVDIPPATRAALAEHFAPDAKTLAEEFGVEAPWLVRWSPGDDASGH